MRQELEHVDHVGPEGWISASGFARALLRPIGLFLLIATVANGAPPRGRTPVAPVKLLSKTLGEEGFSARALLYVRNLGGAQRVQFREAAFTRMAPPPARPRDRVGYEYLDCPPSAWTESGLQVPVFKVTSKWVLDGTQVLEASTPMLRLTRTSPQMSMDRGKSWVTGEKKGTQWLFAFDAALYTFDQADETFTPQTSKAWAFERGPAVKFPRKTLGPGITYDCPVFQSLVIALNYGRNEITGSMKFPGTDWVISFRGIKWGGGWVALSTDAKPFVGEMALKVDDAVRTRGFFGELQAKPLWLVFSEASVLVGVGRDLDFAHPDRTLDGLTGASEFEMKTAKALPGLAEAFRIQQGRGVWLRSDEPDSFSWAADKAFVEAGLVLNLYPPIRNVAFNADAEKAAKEQVDRWSKRIKSLGGSVVLTTVPTL